jgi:N-acetylglucosaminyldiphosphoundecaprenol N-acetyl-beta-D-mannosaminyltransferase
MDSRATRLNVLGVGISPVSIPATVGAVAGALDDGRKGYVCVTGAHGVMEAQKDSLLRAIDNRSFLTVPDGMPLVWLGRRSGFAAMDRVHGPDLMKAVCRESVERGWIATFGEHYVSCVRELPGLPTPAEDESE